MKRFLIITAIVLFNIVFFTLVFAGDYHFGKSLICSDCHVIQPGMGSDIKPGSAQTSGSIQYPLKGADINETCKTCHNGGGPAPDVVEINTGNNIPQNGREAGALNDTYSFGNSASHKGHTLGSTIMAPHGTWSNPNGLNCADCHDPHGTINGAVDIKGNSITSVYRNLNTKAGGAPDGSINVSYQIGTTNDLTKDVFERSTGTRNHYDITNIDFNEPNNTKSGMAEFCIKCHTNILSDGGGIGLFGGFIMHPAAGINIGESGHEGGNEYSSKTIFGSKPYRIHVMSESGNWGTYGSTWTSMPRGLTPTCLSCHKAHGNKNPFDLIYAKGTSNLGEEGDGKSIKDLCQQCHD